MTVKITKPVKPALEGSVQADIREALGLEPDLYLMRNAQWEGHIFDERAGKGRYVKAGLPTGSADLVGILRLASGIGLFFALEVKRAKGGVMSDEQHAWGALVRFKGGFYSAVRSVEEAKTALARARRGARE